MRERCKDTILVEKSKHRKKKRMEFFGIRTSWIEQSCQTPVLSQWPQNTDNRYCTVPLQIRTVCPLHLPGWREGVFHERIHMKGTVPSKVECKPALLKNDKRRRSSPFENTAKPRTDCVRRVRKQGREVSPCGRSNFLQLCIFHPLTVKGLSCCFT